MTLFEQLDKEFDGDLEVLKRIAYSVIHQNCKLVPDLKRHYQDMEQSIYEEWLIAEVDTSYAPAQIVKYAKEKARYVIQTHLMQFNIAVHVKKSPTKGMLDFSELDYSNINFDEELSHRGDEESTDMWLRSAHYLILDQKDSWLVWLLSEGFSVKQASIVMGVSRVAANNRLLRIKNKHATAH